MRSGLLVFAIAAMVMAVPLVVDAYAQQTTGSLSDIVSKAETGANPNGGKNTDVKLTFRSGITLPATEAERDKVFTIDGKAVTVESYSGPDTEIILRLAVADAFTPDARPEVAIARSQSFTSGTGLNIVTYNTGSVTADDKIQPDVLSCPTNAVDPCGAKVTGKQTVTIVYDEPTTARIQDYVNLRISKHGFDSAPYPARNLVSIDGSGTDTHILTFAGKPSNTGSRGSLEILTEVRDLAGNNLDDFSLFRSGQLTDGQDPIILKAYVYDGTHIWLHASENLYQPNTTDSTSLEHLDANSFTNIRLSDVVRGSCGTGTEEPDSLQMGGARVVWGSGSFDSDTGERIHKIQIMESSLNDICMNIQSSGIMTIGEVRDVAFNKIQRTPNFAVSDGQPPTISFSKITGPNQFTIKADEPLLVPEGTFDKFVIYGKERAISDVSGADTDTLTVEFAGRALGTHATATGANNGITIKNTLADLSGNPATIFYNGTRQNLAINPNFYDDRLVGLADGQPPELSGSPRLEAPNLIRFQISESIDRTTSGPNLVSFGNMNATGAAGFGTVQVHGERDKSNVLSKTIARVTTALAPSNLNCWETAALEYGICLTANEVYLRFGDVNAADSSPDTPLADDVDDGVSFTIVNLADTAGNKIQNQTFTTIPLQQPKVRSAIIVNSTAIQISFTEPVLPAAVQHNNSDQVTTAEWLTVFSNLRLSSQDGVSRTITNATLSTVPNFSYNPAIPSLVRDKERHIDIVFSEADKPISTNETATIDIRNLRDKDNPTRSFVDRLEVEVKDDLPPVVTSAKITGPNEMTVEFSEAVTAKKSDFTQVKIGTGNTATDRTIKEFALAADSKSVTFTFSGDEAADDAEGSVRILANGGVADTGTSNNVRLAPGTPGDARACQNYLMKNSSEFKVGITVPDNLTPFVGSDSINDNKFREHVLRDFGSYIYFISCTVSDGQKPMLESLAITGPNEITADFTEPVKQGTRDGGVADGFVGFRIGENDRRNTTINGDITVASDPITLRFGGSKAALTDSGTITITGDLVDAAGNKFDQLANQEVKAGQVPYIKKAEFTGPNQVTITFSERVTLPRAAAHFDNLRISGESSDRDVTSAATLDAGLGVRLKFAGDPVSTGATGMIDVSGATDAVSNVMAAAPQTPITDLQRPTVSPKLTGPNQITVTFSEPVTATSSDFGRETFDNKMVLNLGTKSLLNERTISDFVQVSPNVFTMSFDGDMTMTGDAAGEDTGYIIISDDIVDMSKNKFMPTDTTHGEMISDGQEPKLYRAELGEGKYIQIVYSESTTAPRGSYFNLNFAGDVKSLIDRPHTGDRHHLNYTDSPATAPTATLSVGTGIADAAGNKVTTTGTIQVYADKKPEVMSAKVTHDNEITVVFSEPVKNAEKQNFEVGLEGSAVIRNPLSVGGMYTDTIKLKFADNTFAAGTTGTISIRAGITDLLEKPLAAVSAIPISPLQADATRSALVTGPNDITITFNERVIASSTNFDNLEVVISGEKQARSIDSVSGSGTDTIVISFGGGAAPSGATAEVDIVRVTNADGETYEALRDVSIGDGQVPTLNPVGISSSNSNERRAATGDVVTLRFTASEQIQTPAVTINEETASPVQGDGNMWSATRTITAADLDRESKIVQFTIDYTDTADNAGERVAVTTDNSRVTTTTCPKGQAPHPYQDGTCIEALGGTVKVGLLLSVAREFASEGQETRVAAAKAVSDFNAWLEENDRGWTLSAPFMDTQLRPATALEQVRALKAEGVDVIVGVPTSATVSNIKNFIDGNGMVAISCCSTAPSLATPDGIFRMVPNDSTQAPLLAKQVTDSGIDEVVIIHRNDTWGVELRDAISGSFAGTVITSVQYEPGTTDFASVISRASGALDGKSPTSTGVVFLGWSEIVDVMTAASDNAILSGVNWFGSGNVSGDHSIISNDTARAFAEKTNLTSVEFTQRDTDVTAQLISHIRSELDRTPSVYSHATYDAVWVAALAIDRAQSTVGSDVLPQVQVAARERSGAMGPNALDSNGDLALRNYTLWVVENGRWVDKGQISTSSVTGRVCVSTVNDGVCGPDDPGLVIDPPYKMYIERTDKVGDSLRVTEVNPETGEYRFDNVTPGIPWNVQTLYYPPGHVTYKDDSWFKKGIVLESGQTETFDVAFYRSPDTDLVKLELRTYNDANRNSTRDAGEDGDAGLVFVMHTYVTGSYERITTDARGSVDKNDILPANWAILEGPPGWLMTSIDYQRTDDTSDVTFYSSKELRVFEPAPGSTHTMTIGLWRAP